MIAILLFTGVVDIVAVEFAVRLKLREGRSWLKSGRGLRDLES